jgi:hypothetical protein
MQHSGEKTEKATPHRLLKARREGKFASSKDFVNGLQFTVFVISAGPKRATVAWQPENRHSFRVYASLPPGSGLRGVAHHLASSVRANHVPVGRHQQHSGDNGIGFPAHFHRIRHEPARLGA